MTNLRIVLNYTIWAWIVKEAWPSIVYNQVMTKKILIIIMHIITAIAVLATIASFVCFLVFPKTTGTVTEINAYPEDTVVEFTYLVEDEPYVRKQNYSGTSRIRFGDERTIWYYPNDPDLSVMPRDFAAYYILAGIFGFAEAAYIFGKRTQKANEG